MGPFALIGFSGDLFTDSEDGKSPGATRCLLYLRCKLVSFASSTDPLFFAWEADDPLRRGVFQSSLSTLGVGPHESEVHPSADKDGTTEEDEFTQVEVVELVLTMMVFQFTTWAVLRQLRSSDEMLDQACEVVAASGFSTSVCTNQAHFQLQPIIVQETTENSKNKFPTNREKMVL